jgi:hypothetical protein
MPIRDGQQGGDHVQRERLDAERPELLRVSHRDHPRHQRKEDQWHHHHADQAHEQIADPFDGHRALAQQAAHQNPCRQRQQDAFPQSDLKPRAHHILHLGIILLTCTGVSGFWLPSLQKKPWQCQLLSRECATMRARHSERIRSNDGRVTNAVD